jgi:peptidoglycan/xylan/chitin deacetylase (PgdA/CDA1 family)
MINDLKHVVARCRLAGERTGRTLAGPLRTHYPGFLFGLPLPRDEVPIFNYHEITPEELEPDLEYLKDNGYVTLSLDEFMRASREKKRPRRCVMLTFDDAWSSFWTVALPLLRRYQMRAVLFAPTHWMGGAGPDGLFMNWAQLRDSVASGLVDVQSHAHRHALVHTGRQLAGFATPDTLRRYHFFDWPMRHNDGYDELGPPPPGTPFYRATPLLSAHRRYLENTEVNRLCREFVAEKGDDFFAQPDAVAQLREYYGRVSANRPGRWAGEQELEREMVMELDRSRELFRAELGFTPRYFAYPWMLGNDRSMQLAQRAGMAAAFGVGVDFRTARRRGLPLPLFGRLKGDWLRCLPGKGRMHALPVLAGRLRRAASLDHLAH